MESDGQTQSTICSREKIKAAVMSGQGIRSYKTERILIGSVTIGEQFILFHIFSTPCDHGNLKILLEGDRKCRVRLQGMRIPNTYSS